ncbi:D-alanyl-D-alanine carboxypeptidase [Microbacterium sp. 10M-3C3]|uniref:D-alanyl-D-alanine carboxypeptidase family protein n=1 Tax=Microbacterium sp. 10M-3C3 TaxID=2483401 RepID=UPI000F6369FD|nr:D-alanyl-D-alanine carboxypeptidase [Microbacterium sp. 10M-3C3]
MTTDAPPPTRRALRTGSIPTLADGAARSDAPAPDAAPAADPVAAVDAALADLRIDLPLPAAESAPAESVTAHDPGAAPVAPVAASAPVALRWVDERTVATPTGVTPVVAPDLLTGVRRRRSPLRPGVLLPIGFLLVVVLVYGATMLLWPLNSLTPQVEAVAVQPSAAPAAAPAWPAQGSAAISVSGIGSASSGGDARAIASITKVVTALVVLDAKPLAVGESGPEYRFTAADRARYWQYRANGESALDVPVGGTLTQYQLLEGMLIGSANNYADRLAGDLWPSDAVYAQAARSWLATHGLPGITIVDPSGIEAGNTATPEALLALGAKAMANPVISEIVRTQSVELPGAGSVTNTNPLLTDPGFVGIKTGTLDAYNLLTAKDVQIGDTTVRLYAAVLGQPDATARDDATRALYTQTETELQLRPSVTAGTVAGIVETRWGERVDVVTAEDAAVVQWNGAGAAASAAFDRGDRDAAGDVVGTLTVTGPLNAASVDLTLADDIEGPTPWWRLTHPLDLLGLNG